MPTESSPNAKATIVAADDVTMALYRAAIGPVGTDHFLKIFTRFDASERISLHWNWFAASLTLNWLVFRKLWHAALGYSGAVVALALIIFGIGRLVFQFSDTVERMLAVALGALLVVLPGLFGNALFHADCRRRMTLALRNSPDEIQACAALNRQATTRKRLAGLLLTNALLAAALVASYLQWTELTTLSVGLPHAAQPAPSLAAPASAPVVQASSIAPVASAQASSPATASAATPPASAPLSPASAAPTVPCEGCLRPVVVSADRSAKGPVQTEAPTKPQAAEPQKAASQPATQPKAIASAIAAGAPKPQSSAARPKLADSSKPFVINVGLFAVESNAAGAYAKLQDAGLPATLEKFSTSKGPRTRVRVGPFGSRDEAQAAVEKIRALSLEAIIIEP